MIQMSEADYEELRAENRALRSQIELAERLRVTELARMRDEIERLRELLKSNDIVDPGRK